MIVEIYIGSTKLDLYNDEQLNVVDSIQDAKDLGSIKTIFSKTFTVPASKNNQTIFKHWDNPEVQNSLDVRYKADAHISINGTLFREGSIRAISAQVKDNVAVSYELAFIGNTVTLADTFEDDKLDQLDLSSYDHTYNEATVKTGLDSSLSSGAIRYPLIYHTTRYFYTTVFTDVGGNGLDYRELKPAIQLKTLIDEIESQYDDITWASGGYWDDADFAKLYLWCHRDEGELVGGDELQQVSVPYSEWSGNYNSGDGDITPITTSSTYTSPTDYEIITYSVDYNVVPSGSELYDVEIVDVVSGDTLHRSTNQTGNTTFSASMTWDNRTYEPKMTISTTDSLASFTCDIDLHETTVTYGSSSTLDSNYTTTTTTFSITNEVVIASQIPAIPIMEFLTNLFKMFNLTAYLNASGEIMVETLDDFYDRAVERDITSYVEADAHTVRRTVPYSKIKYSFADKVTKLAIEHDRKFADQSPNGEFVSPEFGNLEYTDFADKYDGDTYEVNVGFEKMMYEAQFSTAGAQTDLTSGWFVDKKDEPVLGSPLVMYIENTSCSTNQIDWDGAAANSTTYNRPSNSSSTNTINFNAEIDEHTLAVKTYSLFDQYHDNYIAGIFDRYSRIMNFKAILPLSFILSYNLYDTLIIGREKYRINSIRINLNTGRANLELINIIDVI